MPHGDEAGFDWAVLVPLYIHPAKIAIIEALRWIQEPLSANELVHLLGPSNYRLGTLAYHLNDLADRGAIEQVYERQVRGARETYFFFPGP